MSEPTIVKGTTLGSAYVAADPVSAYNTGPGLVSVVLIYGSDSCAVDFTEEQCLALENALREARESLW